MAHFTVLGAEGFIGSHLVAQLRRDGFSVYAPRRKEQIDFSRPLGNIVYCIGLTADFRERPLDTAEAHVSVLIEFLRRGGFESFLYLSSTRIYEGASTTDETTRLLIDPANPNHIFNVTKLAGEICCLSQVNPKVRICRISNVVGFDLESQNFLYSIVKDAAREGHVGIQTTPDSAKDYVDIDDVVELIIQIVNHGKQRIYNIASGKNLTNREILSEVVRLTGATVAYASDGKRIVFPEISTERIQKEFGFTPRNSLEKLEAIYAEIRKRA